MKQPESVKIIAAAAKNFSVFKVTPIVAICFFFEIG
jgi:hypothetical protein